MKLNEKYWNRIAGIAAIFTILICVLLIANYLQLSKTDPINQTVINSLVERLNQNPSDHVLREQIREIDLLSRKAYFTNQWQIRMGGYLVLVGIAIIIISLQIVSIFKKKEPILQNNTELEDYTNKKSRKWITISGAILIVFALLSAFLSNNKIEKKYALVSTNNDISSTKIDTQQQENTIQEKEEIIDSVSEKIFIDTTKKDGNYEEGLKDNFPTFRGVGCNAIVKQRNIPISWDGASGKNLKWKIAIPLQGYNSPILWGSKLFLTGADAKRREVYCINKNTGKIIWTYKVEKITGSPSQAPVVNSETGFAAPTAATDGKGVYAIFSNGDIVGLTLEGSKIWAENLGMPQNHYGYSSSLLVFNEQIFVQYDQKSGGKLMAISTLTGKKNWSIERNVKTSWASPILAKNGNQHCIILAAEPFVAAYHPSTGKELWKIDCISGEVGPSPVFSNGMVFSVNDYSKLSAIKIGDNPQLAWENDEFLSDVPSPVANDKYIFLVTSYGLVVCFDAINGTKYWEKEFNEQVYSSPVIVEGNVFVIDRLGVVHIFKADKEFNSIADLRLGEKTVCTPAFSEGRIYLRGDKNLYCFEKK